MSTIDTVVWIGDALATIATGSEVLIKIDAGEPALGPTMVAGGFMTILLALAISWHSTWMIVASAIIDGVLLLVLFIAWLNSPWRTR